MRISLWLPEKDEQPKVLALEGGTFRDEKTLEASSPDGDWGYTVQLIDGDDSFFELDALLHSPARARFTARYMRETPEGIDPLSLLWGEAGWVRIFSREGETFVDFLRVS